jgi:general secretion pathway protein D
LGNTLMNGGAMGMQGGTAPSFAGLPSTANPAGSFPGNAASGTAIGASAADQLITGGLRNPQNTLFTFTGILTDPQFRVVIKALEQRSGVEMLSEPEVTVISGRQAQMKATEVKTVIIEYSFDQNVGNVGGVGGGGGTR